MAALLFMIPYAISTSLFVEGSHGEALKRTVAKSLVTIFSLPVPAAFGLYLCGGWVLGVLGAEYTAGGVEVLRAMVVASLFVGVNYVYFAIKRIREGCQGDRGSERGDFWAACGRRVWQEIEMIDRKAPNKYIFPSANKIMAIR